MKKFAVLLSVVLVSVFTLMSPLVMSNSDMAIAQMATAGKPYPHWDSTRSSETQLEWARSSACAEVGLKYDWSRPIDHPEACVAPVPTT